MNTYIISDVYGFCNIDAKMDMNGVFFWAPIQRLEHPTKSSLSLKQFMRIPPNGKMEYIGFNGSDKLLKMYHSKTYIEYNVLIEYLCLGGHTEIIETVLNKNTNYETELEIACYAGNADAVELLIKKGANKLNNALGEAIRGGQAKICELLLSKGAIAQYTMNGNRFLHACTKGHVDMVKLLMKHCDVDYDIGLIVTCSTKFENVSGKCIEGALIDIVKILLEHSTKCVNVAMKHACEYGSIGIVKLLLEHGASNIDECLTKARHYNQTNLVDYLIAHKKT